MIGLFFLKFYRSSHDRFFLMFALAFWLEALGRGFEAMLAASDEYDSVAYLTRLVAYVLILAAIFDKNVRPGGTR